MTRCYQCVVASLSRQLLCYYGAQGCTAAPLSKKPSISQDKPVTGLDPKQASGLQQQSHQLNVELSSEYGMQDLYLLLRAFSEGGYELSVTVQATPPRESARSPLDIAEQFISSIAASDRTVSHICLAALIPHLRSTTPSSKQRGLSRKTIRRWKRQQDDEPDGYLG